MEFPLSTEVHRIPRDTQRIANMVSDRDLYEGGHSGLVHRQKAKYGLFPAKTARLVGWDSLLP